MSVVTVGTFSSIMMNHQLSPGIFSPSCKELTSLTQACFAVSSSAGASADRAQEGTDSAEQQAEGPCIDADDKWRHLQVDMSSHPSPACTHLYTLLQAMCIDAACECFLVSGSVACM